MNKRKEREEDEEKGKNEDDQFDYTLEELNQLYKHQLIEIAQKKLSLTLSNNDIKAVLIDKILEHSTQRNKSTLKDHNPILPWNLIERIFTLAFESCDYGLCTCVHHDEMRDIHRHIVEKTKYSIYYRNEDKQHQQVFFANIAMQPSIKRVQLKREEMCTFHQNYYSHQQPLHYNPTSFIFVTNDEWRKFEREANRWKLSMGLLSKRFFTFISTHLIHTAVIEPNTKSWNHFKNEYCIIKKPKIVTFTTTMTPCFPRDDQFAKEFFSNVEEVHIKAVYVIQNIYNLGLLAKYAPNIRKMVVNCAVHQTVLNELFEGNLLKNLVCVDFSSSDSYLTCQKVKQTIKKVYLPIYTRLGDFYPRGIYNFEAINTQLHGGNPPANYDIFMSELPKLKHYKTNSLHYTKSMPQTITKITLTSDSYLPSVDTLNKFIYLTTLKLVTSQITNVIGIDFKSVPSINKIIIVSNVDIVQSDVTKMNSYGFEYIGLSLSILDRNTKIFRFIKKSPSSNLLSLENQPSSNHNHNILTTSPITSTDHQSQILPNYIILKIIDMVWKLREYCTCIYDPNIINRWVNEGLDILNDDDVVNHYFKVRNQCSVHFLVPQNQSHIPLFNTLSTSNRSKLQLSLINKRIFNHIAHNLFTGLIITKEENRINGPYCIAGKNIKSWRGLITQELPKFDISNVTKLATEFFPSMYLDHLPRIVSLKISMTQPQIQNIDLSKLYTLESLTKLDISGLPKYQTDVINYKLMDQLSNIQKLYLPINDIEKYSVLSDQLKKTITSISYSFRPTTRHIYKEFVNLQHVYILYQTIPLIKTDGSASLPVIVNRITSCVLPPTTFIISNPKIHTLKYQVCGFKDEVENFIKSLTLLSKEKADQTKHLTTFILKVPTSHFHIPTELVKHQFKLIHSRAKYESGQYLTFERIIGRNVKL